MELSSEDKSFKKDSAVKFIYEFSFPGPINKYWKQHTNIELLFSMQPKNTVFSCDWGYKIYVFV